MKIIEIEGLDKSGKHTQTNFLVKYLRSKGYKVERGEFHRYDTPTGQLIRKYLYHEYNVNKTAIELIMTADKVAQQDWFEELETQGVDYLVLDRYIGSQIAFGKGAGNSQELIDTLTSLVRQPDISILLDISPETSMSRKGKHGENDRYESDKAFLSRVREEYFNYFDEVAQEGYILRNIDSLSVDQVALRMQAIADTFTGNNK